MMRPATPHAEFEVLAAQNRRVIAEHGLPAGWLTDDQVTTLLVANVVDRAAGHAERAFLASVGMPPKRADKAVASCIANLFDEAHRAADFLSLAAEERLRLQTRAADLFDHRLAFLRAFAIHITGRA